MVMMKSLTTGSEMLICSICSNGFCPAIDDLQCISTCGHLFHSFCLHQWVEKCSQESKKLPKCPSCHQPFSTCNLVRLFLNLVPDPSSSLQRPSPEEKDVIFVQEKIEQGNDEVFAWKLLLKREKENKEQMVNEKKHLESLLQMKTEELSRKLAECDTLSKRSLILDSKLQSLISSMGSPEKKAKEAAKVQSEKKDKDEVDRLRKALARRNKSYKKLKAQCDFLASAGAKTLKNLDKTKGKLKEFKKALHQLQKGR